MGSDLSFFDLAVVACLSGRVQAHYGASFFSAACSLLVDYSLEASRPELFVEVLPVPKIENSRPVVKNEKRDPVLLFTGSLSCSFAFGGGGLVPFVSRGGLLSSLTGSLLDWPPADHAQHEEPLVQAADAALWCEHRPQAPTRDPGLIRADAGLCLLLFYILLDFSGERGSVVPLKSCWTIASK